MLPLDKNGREFFHKLEILTSFFIVISSVTYREKQFKSFVTANSHGIEKLHVNFKYDKVEAGYVRPISVFAHDCGGPNRK